MKFNFTINHDDLEIPFSGELVKGRPHTIEIGEPILADLVFEQFFSLCDNVLALGDSTMFLRGLSVRHNIYKVLRFRNNRKTAKKKTTEALKIYKLNPKTKIKHLSPAELLNVALARAHFRKPELVVVKKYGYLADIDVDLSRWGDVFIVVIN